MNEVRVRADVHLSIVRHALDCDPDEACGLLAGPLGADVTVFYPIRNADCSPVSFTLDPHEHLAAENDADQRDLQICGVMHSHPTSPAWPSPTDVKAIARFDPAGTYVNLIVSLQLDEPELRGFRIVDGQISEVPLQIGSRAPGR